MQLFSKLQTLQTILEGLAPGDSVLTGFVSTFQEPGHLPILEKVAQKSTVPVYATLSLAAARHFNVNVPSFVVFSNKNETKTYRGDLRNEKDVLKFLRDNTVCHNLLKEAFTGIASLK